MPWKWWIPWRIIITAKFCHTSPEILITHIRILHDKLVSDMADFVQWCRDKATQTISIEIWRSYLPADILSNKTEHIPQKPWSFLFPPWNYKAYWMQPGFGARDWPYCFSKRWHRVLFLLNSTPLHGACVRQMLGSAFPVTRISSSSLHKFVCTSNQ